MPDLEKCSCSKQQPSKSRSLCYSCYSARCTTTNARRLHEPSVVPHDHVSISKCICPSTPTSQDPRPDSPDVQVAFMVEEPQELLDMFSTPSGTKYSRQQLSKRTVHSLTPGGMHCRTFYMGQTAEQVQQQQQVGQDTGLGNQQQQPEQGLQQQQDAKVPGQQLVQQANPLFSHLRQQQQQQQQVLDLLSKQQQQLVELRQSVAQQAQQQPPASTVDAQQPVQALQQELLVLQQQMQRLDKLWQQQQQAGQQISGLQQQSSDLLQNMGGVDPIAKIWQPYISSQPGLNAVLGAAGNSVTASSVSTGQAALLVAIMQQREDHVVKRTIDGVAALLGGTAAAAAAATAATNQSAQAVGSHPIDLDGSSNQAQPAAAHNASNKQKDKAKGAASGKIGFPDLSTHSSFVDLAEWYYVNTLGNTGQTPQQLESAGTDNNYQWRGGPRHRYQRWSEYVQLLNAIEAERDRLTDEERHNSNHPHRVTQVDAVAAARELDVQRKRLTLSLCEFREYKLGKGKGFKKGKAKEAELEAAVGADASS